MRIFCTCCLLCWYANKIANKIKRVRSPVHSPSSLEMFPIKSDYFTPLISSVSQLNHISLPR